MRPMNFRRIICDNLNLGFGQDSSNYIIPRRPQALPRHIRPKLDRRSEIYASKLEARI